MSRLDSFIRRISAQRDCLEVAAALIAALPGPVLELGLGNGRTFDHLRSLLPDREIFVFDRVLNAHPSSIPDAAHLLLGDFRDTLPGLVTRFRGRVALAHGDFGSGDKIATDRLAAAVARLVAPLMAPGGVVASDQPLVAAGWSALPLPDGVPAERYFLYRC